ncbi:peptidoglycan bridge formation glycyltransferase FemA/FemB family protein [Candidatus Dojkabacteria bacterium]|nr:peptidoglycan bridge formation glycyltransferase FemA/FemB family protein [Candidatus Dojkabacteria bacterium]
MIFHEVDTQKEWDSFIYEHDFPTSFLQSWNAGEFYKSIGNSIARIGAYDENKLKGIALVQKVAAKRGKMLHVRHGPVLDYDNERLVDTFIDYLKELTLKEKYDFLRISPQIKPGSKQENFLCSLGFNDSQMHDVDAEITWVLDLEQSEEQILNGMRKNTRYYINRAKRDGVEIIKSQDIQDLNSFWEIYQDTVKRHKWNAYDFNYIKKQFKVFVKDNQIMLFLSKYNDKYIGGSLFTYFKDQAVYHHSGTLSEYSKVPSAYLLQWESILEAKARGLKKYNFWGIAPTDKNDDPKKKHPWYGLTFFKMGFGGEVEHWIHAKDMPVSKKYWLTHVYEKVERKLKGY